MHEIYLKSLSDTLLVAVPFLATLAMAIFRLDTFLASSKGPAEAASPRRAGCGMDENGEPVLVDPDGQLSINQDKRKHSSLLYRRDLEV